MSASELLEIVEEAAGKVPKVDQVWQSLESDMSGLRIKVTAIDEQHSTFDAEVVTSPYGKSLAYPIGRSMRVSRSRLCQPAQYKWGYELVEDVEERRAS